VRATPDAPVSAAWLEDATAQVDAYATSATMAPATLTTAELRILALAAHPPLLPRDGIAALRLAQHGQDAGSGVYRKLDASSRSEAVARANELGLLEG
jgi:hypothetical protein